MSFDYIRRYYGVPARKGGRVALGAREGTITSATHYVHVRFDDCKGRYAVPCHPTDLRYLDAPEARTAGQATTGRPDDHDRPETFGKPDHETVGAAGQETS